MELDGLSMQFSDMAGFEEVNLADLSSPKVAKHDNVYDNVVNEDELIEESIESDMNDLMYENPAEFERLQSGGEANA